MTKEEIIKQYMSELGRKSAEARKKKGHDSKYYSEMSKKRWKKRRAKLEKEKEESEKS